MTGGLDRWLTGFARRWVLPRWASATVGVLCVLAGAVLTVRPFTSIGVLVVLVAVAAVLTGVGELSTAGPRTATSSSAEAMPQDTADGPPAGRAEAPPWWQWVAGVVWIVAGIAVAVWPGLGVAGVAVWVGAALVLTGVLRAAGAVVGRSRTADARVADGLLGVAGIVLGVLALAWPDVTVLVVAVVFGVRGVWFGLTLLWDAVRRPATDTISVAPGEPSVVGTSRGRPRRGVWGRFTRLIGAVVALLLAAALGAVSIALHRGTPRPDAFYTAPATVPNAPGALLRAEPYTTTVPASARAWRILYTTTTTDGTPTVGSGIVLVSRSAPAGDRPVIAWAHGTTGFARGCAPSLLKAPFTAGALPALDQIISNGWVLVAPDYTGLGTTGVHPYLIGPGEAHAVLDAIRAAHHLHDISLADTTIVWGHSQGGNAALWTGQLAASYAPDVHLSGIAALAPASDLTALAGNLDTVPGGAIFASYIVAAYTATYPDVRFNDYIRPAARAIVRADAQRCLAEPEVFVSIASSLLADKPIFTDGPDQGPFGVRLRQNTPTGPIPAPVFLGQGQSDALVLPAVQDAYVRQRCTLGGGPLQYQTYPGLDHVGVVADTSPLIPDLLTWTQNRINGRTAPSTC